MARAGITAASDNQMNDLAGKDYFTVAEAAHFACVSIRKFSDLRKQHNITPFQWGGKAVFRRCDIVAAMEQERIKQWQQLNPAAKAGISTGRKMGASTAAH